MTMSQAGLPRGFPPTGLPFDNSQVPALIKRYHEINCKSSKTDAILDEVITRVQEQGYLDTEGDKVLGAWKYSTGLGNKIASNGDEVLREATRKALSTSQPILALKHLLPLRGFGVPTASAFLHLFHSDTYPLLDDYALLALGLDTKSPPGKSLYESTDSCKKLYLAYVESFRRWVPEYGISSRDLDRCLWVIGHDKRKGVSS